jgi:tRNA pseudouridine55 synthase
MNGVLVVNKPSGPTSHDVVAVARRALRERRVGHTGTLDPLASGVLPLACGKATRLARFFSASDKEYVATVRFGVETDTYDITGDVVAESGSRPTRGVVDAALTTFMGEHLQTPPTFSAKRVAGRRAYDLARGQQPVVMTPVRVVLAAAAIDAWSEDEAVLRLTCSAGFYVRSFAHELGRRVGSPACLSALRRTRAGSFAEACAVGLDVVTSPPSGTWRDGAWTGPGWIPMSGLLLDFPAVIVAESAREWVANGRVLEPEHFGLTEAPTGGSGPEAAWTRLLDPSGELLGLAKAGPVPGSLHPALVLI